MKPIRVLMNHWKNKRLPTRFRKALKKEIEKKGYKVK
jgi:phage head maturation protease